MKVVCGHLLALLVAFLAGCATMKVESDYRASALPEMRKYRTYAWMQFPAEDNAIAQSELIRTRVIGAVDRELAAKGYEKTDSGEPDFLIGYHGALQKRTDIEKVTKKYEDAYGYVYGLPDTHTETFVREFTEGMLMLDIVDGSSKTLVWRGQAKAEVTKAPDPETRSARINKAVKKILERFPPKE
jgi:hypothetical protein